MAVVLHNVQYGRMDWEQVSREVIRAVRGKQSQAVLSRRLGYKGRAVTEWESGRKFPYAAVFFRACTFCGVDVVASLETFHLASAHDFADGGDAGVAAWLRALRGKTKIGQLALRTNIPRFSVSRFLTGQSRPRLPQFLALLEGLTGRASDLIGALVGIESVPSLNLEHGRRLHARKLAYSKPWTAAILNAIEVESYKEQPSHENEWLAERLGLDSELVASSLTSLFDSGTVRIDPQTKKYVCTPQTIDTQGSYEDMRQLKTHWANVATSRIGNRPETDLHSYSIAAVSHDDAERIREILIASFREIRGLVASSAPSQEVILIQLQLTGLMPNAGLCAQVRGEK